MDEITRHPAATDADDHTNRPDPEERREEQALGAARQTPETGSGYRTRLAVDGRTGTGSLGTARPDSGRTDPGRLGAGGRGTDGGATAPGPAALPFGSPAATGGPAALDATGMTALLRLAVLCVDPDGRISYWNRGAEELFGHRWEHVFGHPASGLLTPTRAPAGAVPTASGTAHQDTLDVLDDLTTSAWAGALAATDRDGTVKDVLWWTYRIAEPGGRSLLAIAANARPLRTGSLRIAVGGRLLPYTAEGPQRQDIAIAAVLSPAPDPAQGHALTARLGTVLPGVSPGRLDRIVRQIAPLGHPALEVEGSVRLPVTPQDYAQIAAAARADRSARRELLPGPRPDPAATPGPASGPASESTTPRYRTTTHGGDRSSASSLTAVPFPSAGPAGTAGPSGPAGAFPPHPAATPPAPVLPETAAHPGRPAPAVAGHGSRSPLPGSALDEQLSLLRETGSVVGSTLDLHTTARELCAVTVPRFADLATVLVVDQLFSDTEPPKDDRVADTVLVRRVAVADRSGPGAGWDAALPEGELLTLPGQEAIPRLGDPVLLPVVDSALAPDIAADLGVPAVGRLLAGHSLILAPLTARGTVLGRICFLRSPGRRPFDARDAATAAEIAARGAVHLDNARLHRLESRAAATLQRSMMPTKPPRIPGVQIAHHYMPGDRQAQVGGDWFDAIQLPGGRVALIVGDVMGHGLQAAAVMGQFRTSVITMAALDLPPAQLLRHLDNLAQRLGTDHLATCVYAVYDPIQRTLTLANAGHIPPVLAGHDGRGELLQIPGGAPIGVGGVPFETVEIPAPDGSWLVLCTDGLVEVRGQGIDAGLAALCAHVIEPQQTPEDVCAQILSRVHSEDRRDDVALLVARFEGIAPQDVAQWRLRVDDSEVARARDLTRRQLAAWGLERLSDTTELLVSELVTNAFRAASYEVELRLMRVGKLLVEVSDDNHNLPQLQRAEADDVRGRGLALVSHMSRRWGTSRKAVGKVVWFELPLPS
ncbi:SpoIIE family protein phosphatase [Streptomyces cocklensis]|uniref:protein-serine/threonine phosphatase n=1 Tax=Actinacidiphila cocklensis TaxID=887465 RepID=A0A9W4GUD7_9ACTN|nr:SpoIIE family protein phosphatase [Actinacidiphila cocklensis]MDD1056931.1 SpoIIE family protein phosphatase [Actinacidiphila cocklensis]CAG6398024.1 Serine phosphatase RsbU, regulator of sigma subunit [Actinacidiphila cocklensis]